MGTAAYEVRRKSELRSTPVSSPVREVLKVFAHTCMQTMRVSVGGETMAG